MVMPMQTIELIILIVIIAEMMVVVTMVEMIRDDLEELSDEVDHDPDIEIQKTFNYV